MIQISDGLSIPEEEIKFSASRSSGPGGQKVNKVSTRVTLSFDVANCRLLTEAQKRLIRTRLATRISKEGILRVVSQKSRSQASNRQAALQRLVELLQEALKPRPRRKKRRVSLAARQRRLEEKRRRGRQKRLRARQTALDE